MMDNGNCIACDPMQEEYNREQIPWQDIPFSDNQPCIDLIAAKPHGILRILDDQSCFPQVGQENLKTLKHLLYIKYIKSLYTSHRVVVLKLFSLKDPWHKTDSPLIRILRLDVLLQK